MASAASQKLSAASFVQRLEHVNNLPAVQAGAFHEAIHLRDVPSSLATGEVIQQSSGSRAGLVKVLQALLSNGHKDAPSEWNYVSHAQTLARYTITLSTLTKSSFAKLKIRQWQPCFCEPAAGGDAPAKIPSNPSGEPLIACLLVPVVTCIHRAPARRRRAWCSAESWPCWTSRRCAGGPARCRRRGASWRRRWRGTHADAARESRRPSPGP